VNPGGLVKQPAYPGNQGWLDGNLRTSGCGGKPAEL